VSGLAVISENLLQLQYAGLTIGALSGLMPVGLALIYIRRRLRLQMQFGRSIDVVTCPYVIRQAVGADFGW